MSEIDGVLLDDAQRAALVPRPTPERVDKVDGLSSVGVRLHIDAEPSRAWEVVAVKFGDIDLWGGAGIAESQCTTEGGVGRPDAVRVCKVAEHMPIVGGSVFEERILQWDPERRYLLTAQNGSAGPMKVSAEEIWIDAAAHGGTTLTAILRFKMKFPMSLLSGMASRQFKRKLAESKIGLKHYIETGEPVTGTNWKAIVAKYPHILRDSNL